MIKFTPGRYAIQPQSCAFIMLHSQAKQTFFTVDILICHGKKSTLKTNSVNDGIKVCGKPCQQASMHSSRSLD